MPAYNFTKKYNGIKILYAYFFAFIPISYITHMSDRTLFASVLMFIFGFVYYIFGRALVKKQQKF